MPSGQQPIGVTIAHTTGGLRRDRTMDIAAETHLQEIQENPSSARMDVVRATLIRHGDDITRLRPVALLGPKSAQRRKRLLRELAQGSQNQGFTHFGVAQNRMGVVVLLGRRLLAIPPFPPTRGQSTVRVRGRALVTDMTIQAWQMGPCPAEADTCGARPVETPIERHRSGQFSAEFSTPVAGWWTLQLTADIGLGPEVAMLRRVWAGPGDQVPLSRWSAPSKPSSAGRDTASQWLHRLRRRHGEARLKHDRRLETAAHKHAEVICDAGWALHQLPGGSRPEQRAERAGFGGDLVENLAIGGNLSEAWARLVESPAHLHGLLNADSTWVGLGAVTTPDHACLVILLGG